MDSCAARGFRRVAVLTLALGIGANTAIFSVFDAVLLRPLPYRDADRLYVIHEIGRGGMVGPVNALHFREWRASTRSFEDMALIGRRTVLSHRGRRTCARRRRARDTQPVPDAWRRAGARTPLPRGRGHPGRDAVVMLGHDLWTTQFAADPTVIGRRVTLDGAPHDVVGVLPAGFNLAEAATPLRESNRRWKGRSSGNPLPRRPTTSFLSAASITRPWRG